jgi:hypothetical protein
MYRHESHASQIRLPAPKPLERMSRAAVDVETIHIRPTRLLDMLHVSNPLGHGEFLVAAKEVACDQAHIAVETHNTITVCGYARVE